LKAELERNSFSVHKIDTTGARDAIMTCVVAAPRR
jgi:hypothetical protein